MTKTSKLEIFKKIPDSVSLKHLTFTVEVIDRKKAQMYLDAMVPDQRNKKPAKIKQFGDDYSTGTWWLGISALLVDEYGHTMDGNNRLEACVQSGKPFETLVIRGIRKEAITAIDTGTARTFGDLCKMKGMTDPNVVASITKQLWMWQNGVRYAQGVGGPSHAQLEATLDEYKALIHPAVGRGRDVSGNFNYITAATAGFAWLLFKLEHSDQADDFIERLASGAHMPSNHPIMALRAQLSRRKPMDERRLTRDEVLAYIIHCWNAYRDDQVQRSRFQLTRTGRLDNENFPIPK